MLVESGDGVLRSRWLGRVKYGDAHALQRALHRGSDPYLLLLEHPHVYTLGVRADRANVLVEPASVGAELVETDRGGDVTYHGPGQLVGYPILSVSLGTEAIPRFVALLQDVIIGTLETFGIHAFTLAEYPGVWVGEIDAPRKIAAIGIRITRGRSMHGFALNVAPDMGMFANIVPCGIADKAVTSMALEGVNANILDVARRLSEIASRTFGFPSLSYSGVDDALALLQADASHSTTAPIPTVGASVGVERVRSLNARLLKAGVVPEQGLSIVTRKPEWLRLKANMGEEYRSIKSTMRKFSLTTVCEEAGCPNIYECWAAGTATFMINGERCTRACGFCLVDTSKPLPLDASEPGNVARAVKEMGLSFAVITAVARDDLLDGGSGAFAETIRQIRELTPGVGVEVLISDCKGDDSSLRTIFEARPDVLNHNVETVLRLQRAVRPSASYARSLSVLARAKEHGLTTKSGLMVGLGEEMDEVLETLQDMRSVGIDILTVGQYLRPTESHIPVARYYHPDEFGEIRSFARSLGFSHVEASPLARSSYHAMDGARRVNGAMVLADA